jgi:hypothetical protein
MVKWYNSTIRNEVRMTKKKAGFTRAFSPEGLAGFASDPTK